MVLDLVALNREPRVVAAVISRHVIVFESKNIECQPKPQILVTIIGEATGPETLGLGDIGGFFDSGWHIGANVTNRYAPHGSDEGQLHEIGPEGSAFHHVMIIRSGKVTHGESEIGRASCRERV